MPVTAIPTRLSLTQLESRDNPAGGVLDPTFGTDGVVTLPFDYGGRPYTAVLPDGKLLVAHSSPRTRYLLNESQPTVTRLHPNGTIDTSYGTNGTVKLPVAKDALTIAVALQPDGKLLVGASATLKSGDGEYAVARLNANGTLDTTFGGVGTGWWESNPSKRHETVRELAVVGTAGAFSIYVGADAQTTDGNRALTAIRLTAAGKPDPTYGTNGFVSYSPGTGDSLRDMAVTPTGRVILAGAAPVPSGSHGAGVLVAFTPAGRLDTGFDGDGVAYPTVAGSRGVRIFGLAAQGENVIAAGDAGWAVGMGPSGVVFRYTPAGAVDATFADNGVFVGPGNSPTLGSWFRGIVLAADGSVIIVGRCTQKNADGTSNVGMLIGRLSADGQPDATFGPTPDGTGLYVNYSPTPGATNEGLHICLDADGNLIFSAGVTYPPGTLPRPRVMRFTLS